jgi:hypothetical protein
MDNSYTKTEKLAKIIRIITVAPFNVLITMTLIVLIKPEIIGGTTPYILTVLFLAVFPLLAYPIQPITPYFRDKGRNGQRSLSILMSVIGYLLGLALSFILDENNFTQIIYLTYLLSGITIAILSKVIKFNASGHTCGLVGPIAISTYVFGAYALIAAVIIPLVLWASLKLKRHTIMQLIIGSIIPVIIFILLIQLL